MGIKAYVYEDEVVFDDDNEGYEGSGNKDGNG